MKVFLSAGEGNSSVVERVELNHDTPVGWRFVNAFDSDHAAKRRALRDEESRIRGCATVGLVGLWQKEDALHDIRTGPQAMEVEMYGMVHEQICLDMETGKSVTKLEGNLARIAYEGIMGGMTGASEEARCYGERHITVDFLLSQIDYIPAKSVHL